MDAKKLAAKKPHQLTEEDYSARYDAETLMRAEIIKGDETRLANAQEWAKVLVEQEKKEADAMRKVAS